MMHARPPKRKRMVRFSGCGWTKGRRKTPHIPNSAAIDHFLPSLSTIAAATANPGSSAHRHKQQLSPPTTHPPFPKSLNLRTTDRHSTWHPWQLLTFSSFWLQKLHQRNPVAETSCAENVWFHQWCHLFLHVKHHHSYEAGYTQLKNLPPILETKTSL